MGSLKSQREVIQKINFGHEEKQKMKCWGVGMAGGRLEQQGIKLWLLAKQYAIVLRPKQRLCKDLATTNCHVGLGRLFSCVNKVN